MFKHKTFYGNTHFAKDHDEEVQIFLDELSKSEHTFISINTISYGESGYLNKLRTEIAYKENQTRKVIVEKKENNG